MSDVRLSLAIMHLPSDELRRQLVGQMVTQMGGASALKRETEYWEITYDYSHAGVWPTARRAWMAYAKAPKATHHVVLQDDLILCQNFLAGVKAAVSAAPDRPISLYANRKIIAEAKAKDSSWASVKDGIWGQAIVLPVAMVAGFLAWERVTVPPAYKHDDRRLCLYVMEQGQPVYCTVPSLVEHAAPGHSTLGNSNSGRVARWFIGLQDSPLDVDWTKGLPKPPYDSGNVSTNWMRKEVTGT